MKIKVGDKVKMIEKNCHSAIWYSDEIYTVVKIEKDIIDLDRNLKNREKNLINSCYLKSLRKERKKILLNLNLI